MLNATAQDGLGRYDGRTYTEAFAARFTGRLLVRRTATLAFWVSSDDGARLWLDGALVVDAAGASYACKPPCRDPGSSGHDQRLQGLDKGHAYPENY